MANMTWQSNHQKKFKTTSVYKRSKQYFDITRLNKIEYQEEMSRRKPSDYMKDTVQFKFEDSFMSSQNKVHERVKTEITKCSTKGWREEEEQTPFVFTSVRKGKTLDMSKMLSREYFFKTVDGNRNQKNFCNFQPYKLPHNHTINFDKCKTHSIGPNYKDLKVQGKECKRCKSRGGGQIQSIPTITQPQIGKIRQKLTFDQGLFKTLVDFKKHDKEKTQRKPQQTVQLDADRVKVGEQVSKKHQNYGLVQFFHGNTKWQAPQMDNRLVKQNEYFLRTYNNEENKKRDWLIQKRKTDMVDKRFKKIMARKNIKDIKGQICDELYFRRNKI